MKDAAATLTVIAAFGAWVTLHISIVYGLASQRPRERALIALAVPPLAPWLALRERMFVRASLWIVAAVVYGVALVIAVR